MRCATGVSAPTDNDDIAQAHEIGPGTSTFGIREDRDFDPASNGNETRKSRPGVQHQLFSRVSLIAQYVSPNVPGSRDAGPRADHDIGLDLISVADA